MIPKIDKRVLERISNVDTNIYIYKYYFQFNIIIHVLLYYIMNYMGQLHDINKSELHKYYNETKIEFELYKNDDSIDRLKNFLYKLQNSKIYAFMNISCLNYTINQYYIEYLIGLYNNLESTVLNIDFRILYELHEPQLNIYHSDILQNDIILENYLTLIKKFTKTTLPFNEQLNDINTAIFNKHLKIIDRIKLNSC
mgnify:CR=1 FL=1